MKEENKTIEKTLTVTIIENSNIKRIDESDTDEFIYQCMHLLFNPEVARKIILEAMKQFALQESRKAFEAGRTFLDVESSEFKKHWAFLEKLKYKNHEDYLASDKQQPLTK